MADLVDKFKMLGLYTANQKPVPLKTIDVSIKITGTVAEVQSSLSYYNEENDPIEATFTFPMDDGSAVYRFEAEIEGRKLVAEIQEREQAKLTYDDSIQKGKTAALLQQDDKSADIFKCSLGNLPARCEAKLLLAYVIELPQEVDGRLRFTLPTVLNPRYSPEVGGEVAADGATYVHSSDIPYQFSMNAHVQGYHKVMAVTSDGCKLNVQLEDNNTVAKVTLAEEFKFDHDLCLLVQYENSFTPQIVMEMGNPEASGLFKEDLLMLSFRPDLKEVSMASSGEYIFIIDRSGSMDGEKMQNAKEALLLFLKSLPPDCYFNVVSFGNNYEFLFKSGSMKYSEESLKEALELQGRMDADMGGTEIFRPLEHVFKQNNIAKHNRNIFVLTDGQVMDTNEVIGLVKKNAHSTRTFSLGIGYGASTALVNGLARAGNGKAEFIADGSRVQPKVISLLRCAMQPACTHVEVKWDLPQGVAPMLIPAELPSVVTAGERLTLYAIMQGADANTVYGTSTVTLKGEMEGQPVSYTMTFTLLGDTKRFSENSPAHRLATKCQIKILEDEEASFLQQLENDYFYGGQEQTKNLAEIREKIVTLSRHANIISKMTSFIVIDKEGAKVEGKMVERPCPVPTLSEDYFEAMQENMQMDCNIRYCASAAPMHNLKSCGMVIGNEIPRSAKKSGGIMSFFSSALKRKKKAQYMSAAPPPPPAQFIACSAEAFREPEDSDDCADQDSDDQTLLAVIREQKLKGHWDLTKHMADLLKLTIEQIRSSVHLQDDSTVCTLVVVGWLRKFHINRKNEWHLIETKAISWLEGQALGGKSVQELITDCSSNLWP